MSWLKHAFAVDAEGPAEPTPLQQVTVDWFCLQIARRRLTTPGLIMLDVLRPYNYLGSQLMHFSRPGAWALLSKRFYAGYVAISEYLEQRGSLEYMHHRVEYFEAEMLKREESGASIKEYIQQHMEQVRTAVTGEDRQAMGEHGES